MGAQDSRLTEGATALACRSEERLPQGSEDEHETGVETRDARPVGPS